MTLCKHIKYVYADCTVVNHVWFIVLNYLKYIISILRLLLMFVVLRGTYYIILRYLLSINTYKLCAVHLTV